MFTNNVPSGADLHSNPWVHVNLQSYEFLTYIAHWQKTTLYACDRSQCWVAKPTITSFGKNPSLEGPLWQNPTGIRFNLGTQIFTSPAIAIEPVPAKEQVK
ncbi:hypothetical protein HanRHA438_Chr08g0363601 [Helianthus annuus]|nr:hypothetical protein HanRHA438_Chr08g0363601 [Helianthus annuus]